MLEILLAAASRLGVELDDEAQRRFVIYADMLRERSAQMNLTAITDNRGIALKHFADSLSVLNVTQLPQGGRLIDVGTGAGFPGVALLIARPDLDVTLLDGTEKKLRFIGEVLEAIGLNAKLLHARAELTGKEPGFRESFDVVTARAVAGLNTLCELCLPLVKIGGAFVAMKGAKAAEELQQAENAVKLLGGRVKTCVKPEIEDCGERCIVLIEKASHTSPKYPRVSAQIAKHPL